MSLLNRRQLLGYGATLLAATGASWLGYRQLNCMPTVSVNKVGLPLAHLLRDKQLSLHHTRTHDCEILILGSGAAALSAAWYLARHGQRNIMIAEGFERNGNNAAYAHSSTLTAPAGAHYLPQPSAQSVFVRQMLADLGIMQGYDAQGKPIYREEDWVHAPDERLWRNDRWQDGLIPQNDADTQRFFQYIATLRHAYGHDGKKLFAIPIQESSADYRGLDSDTFAQWLAREGYRSRDLLWYLDYCCRDDYGSGIESVSAFAGLHYFAARGNEHAAVLTWQNGLNHLSQQLRQFIQLRELPQFPESNEWATQQPLSLPAVAIQIAEQNKYVAIHLRHIKTGETRLVRAKRVICAMPLMVAQAILADATPYRLNPPEYAPWLVSNFVLHRFPEEMGRSELAWDNVVYGSRGLGYVVATHQSIRLAKPQHTIFTAYTALNHDTPNNIRHWLLTAQAHDLLDIAAQDLLAVYGGKPFWRCVSHVDMTVRAHAMAIPYVGYLQQNRAQSSEKLLFAHSDLSGYSVFEEAVYWGVQAAKQLLSG